MSLVNNRTRYIFAVGLQHCTVVFIRIQQNFPSAELWQSMASVSIAEMSFKYIINMPQDSIEFAVDQYHQQYYQHYTNNWIQI